MTPCISHLCPCTVHLSKSSIAAVFSLALVASCAQAQTPPAPRAAATPSGAQRPQPAPIGVPVPGMPFVHDPSTVVRFHGRYYVYSTGRGIPFYSSSDGATWTREGSVFPAIPSDVHAAVPKNNGMDVWAPDLVRVGDQFYLYYAVSSWGSFQSVVALATNATLDPKDPAYKWVDRGVVVSSDGAEDLNAIDPGVILAPDGTLWICYGSYHGSIRVTQLNPQTGLAIIPGKLGQAIATARESEASDIIFHDGYFYLFVNHGSCCKGKDSQYNIRVGRSLTITGPYLDRHGEALATGGGSLFLAAHDHRIGPGHFGRVLDYDDPADGRERFSVHYEADLTRNGRSVLDIRPLLWTTDDWPVAGDNLSEATYQIVSRQSQNTLGIYAPLPPRPANAAAPAQTAPPSSTPTLHLNRYLALDNEKWTIAPSGAGLYKIVDLGTGDALGVAAASTDAVSSEQPIAFGPFTGADTQLWSLDQFPEGGYRIRNKATGLCLSAASRGSGVVAATFSRDDLHLWTITSP